MSMNRRSLIGAAGLALTAPALQGAQAAETAKPAAAKPAARPVKSAARTRAKSKAARRARR